MSKMIIKLHGIDCYLIHQAMERMSHDVDAFLDEKDKEEFEELRENFYRQWYKQDKDIPKSWRNPITEYHGE